MHKIVVIITFIFFQSYIGIACAVEVPEELKLFISKGAEVLQFAISDLNGDGAKDYIVVLQNNDENRSRTLLIVTRDKNSVLKLSKRNDDIVGCEQCGGVMGDPLQSLEIEDMKFSVSNSGGSVDRWSNLYEFRYSRRDKTWQLVRAEETTYYAPDPDKTSKTNEYRSPKDFGKIDISKFKPSKYLGVGSK